MNIGLTRAGRRLAAGTFVCLVLAFLPCLAADRKPPGKLVFSARPGNVIFDHAAHVRRVRGNCGACHDKLFKQDATAQLNWKPGTHRPAEANRTSCGGCHRPGGTAFETRDHCRRCHVEAPEL